jgi:hypothetical protein
MFWLDTKGEDLMSKRKYLYALSGLTLSAAAALVAAHPAQAEEAARGKELMTPQEQAEHWAKMQGMTPEQLQAYRQQHHAEMQQRAEAQGKTLPPGPAAGYGYPGYMYPGHGYGYGYGGMGPGYGYGMGRGWGRGYGMPGYGPYGAGGPGRAWGGPGRGPCTQAGMMPPAAAAAPAPAAPAPATPAPAAPAPAAPSTPSEAPAAPATPAPAAPSK